MSDRQAEAADERAERQPGQIGFLRVDAELLYSPVGQRLSVDALRVLLVHLKGYTGRRGYSGMGMKGIRERTGLRPKAVKRATEELMGCGLIHPAEPEHPCRPRTLLASASSPFAAAAVAQDGQQYRTLQHSGLEQALLPWALVDASADMSTPTIADVDSAEGLRLLIWLYMEAREDGYVPKRALKARYEDDGFGRNELKLTADDVEMRRIGLSASWKLAAQELLRVGLAYLGAEGLDGCYPLILLHAMASVRDKSAA